MTGRRSPATIGAAATAFLLPVLFSPSVDAPFWSPKAAFLLVVGIPGLLALPALRRTTLRRPATAATAFLGIAVLATVVSPRPLNALTGLYNWGTGLVFLAACAGLWALGACVEPDERSAITTALLAGVGVSIGVAVAQVFDVAPVASLEADGRASGLAGNPVHLGAVAAVLVAIGAYRIRRDWWWAAAIVIGTFAIQLSGTRLALLSLVPIVVGGIARSGLKRGAALVAAAALGLVIGAAVVDASDLQSATGRASTEGAVSIASGGGAHVRLEVWASARHAIADRPMLGSGPGRFGAATSAHRSLDVARQEGGDYIFTDAHNLLVEHLVTTGVLGALALVSWLALAFRPARGELAWAAAALLLMGLAQPMSVGTTPLLFLCLGAAASSGAVRVSRPVLVPAAAGALLLAGALVVGDTSLHLARLDFDLADARRARSLLRPWPQPASMIATIYAFEGFSDPRRLEEAVAWRRRAIDANDTDAGLYILLGDAEYSTNRPDAAETAWLEALERNPWSATALTRLAHLSEEAGDHDAAVRYARRALLVRPNRSLQRLVAKK